MERRIDLQTWERREVFSLFGQGYSPYYDVTVPVDVTELVRLCKAKGLSFYRAMLYVCTRAVNAVPAFLMRIRPDGVYRVDFASPSYTVARQNGVFGIMTTEYIPGEGLSAFCARALAAEKAASADSSKASAKKRKRKSKQANLTKTTQSTDKADEMSALSSFFCNYSMILCQGKRLRTSFHQIANRDDFMLAFIFLKDFGNLVGGYKILFHKTVGKRV